MRSSLFNLVHIVHPLKRRPKELFPQERQQLLISLVQTVELWPGEDQIFGNYCEHISIVVPIFSKGIDHSAQQKLGHWIRPVGAQ